jgi:beta-aspartyl-peptidase (threonine type)
MKNLKFTLLSILSIFLILSCSNEKTAQKKFGIILHGGAGTITRENMTSEMEEAYSAKLTEALETGYKILENGGTSLDAVEKTINIMEDSPLFNSGKGAVFANNGMNELDASIMDGKTLNAGAVAEVHHIKNPISLARLVLDKSKHVLLAGEGAEIFAKMNGVEMVDQSYFYTERRWQSLQRAKEREESSGDQSYIGNPDPTHKFGTVGVAALDKNGNLAAGTSTGGLTNKRYGRIGDSPIIGAGTYANNYTCAVSGTGEGEYFIRLNVTKDISDLMQYKNLTLKAAAKEVIMNKLTSLGGTGGVIAIDKEGNIAMPFNTKGMYRAYHLEGGEPVVKFYKER